MGALAPWLVTTLCNTDTVTTSATVGYDKTFSPEGWKAGNVAAYVDRSGGIPLGYPRITFGMRPPAKDGSVYKVSCKLFYPVLETIDPAVGIFGPKLAYEIQAHMDFLIPARATLAERTAFLSHVKSLFAATITASDGSPANDTLSPLVNGIKLLEDVY